ncbi:hypothetical protein [Peristeroidobacter soli]|uniref:hypothetical protein n=1 Tax=Peristeroidobacter soli TaxID=2497877 RepID=UPI00101B990D|nr:hypothetical protein [Peristeroidobacter soli]
MTNDQIVALLASIGACLSAVATFLTVRQIAKQREASYRPELALSRSIFEGSTDPMVAGGRLPTFWFKKAQPHESTKGVQRLTIPLQNVGLGTAKGVRLIWSFPIADVVTAVNQLAQRTLTPAYFVYEHGAVSIKSDTFGARTSFWKNQENDWIDYVLPASVQNEAMNLTLPDAYVLLCSALVFFGAKDKDAKSFPELPLLRARFEYRDMGEQEHQAGFDIELHLIAFGGEGELIHGYLESRKVA